MNTPSTSTSTPVDPNRPSKLSIVPSSRSTLQLRRPTKKETSHKDPPRTDEVDAEFDEDDEEVEHEQDIDTYGIAGRTWEAAYLMKRYCKPPYVPTSIPSTSKLVFEPLCPLFVQPSTTEDSSSPPPSQRTKQRKRTLVEIGSGTGYLSLHLLPFLKESDRLIVTDLPEVCPLLRTNLGISVTEEGQEGKGNGKAKGSHVQTTLGDVKVRPLPWGDQEAFEELENEFDLLSSADDDSNTGPGPDLILASDLVYFPFLYPGLLRTLIWLTQPRKTPSRTDVDDTSRKGNDVPQVVIGYKIRSLPREEPFWKAFGIWFEFEPVYYRPIATSAQDPNTTLPSPAADEDHWHRFGETSEGQDQLFIFVCTRRPKTYTWDVPKEDEALMNGLGSDDQFETLLLLGMEC
ncbi:BZ3500_MvSof-1268-A1-R1_Chr11-3g03551 [Microbotryum saponariae]|uniref:BZ3500_MvSof-1268-A1-R1_Chr11-3g03551 protein n=1 Tax=Microbotryum saponariae TaxID=289078 RepID=A0A2X0LG96_9BASI|nr:BZ3500_MvSof-1268-A1-R1_Chr11-3g03551 [Microbotryum saponariae]SDA03560.1 BZ3501_MvSof-1269-A2-R1_Chr11g03128 [Microbotryum saponariae]